VFADTEGVAAPDCEKVVNSRTVAQ